MSLLRWNTLDDAALWLSGVTAEAWSPRRILSDALNVYRVPQGKVPPPTCLRCAPPHGTTFARYQWDVENGTPSNPFVFVCNAPYQTVSLYPNQVDDLLKTGETRISMVERPEDAYGRAGEYVFVEPMAQGLKVGVSSVGMSAIDLQEFAGRVVAAKRASNVASSALHASDRAAEAIPAADSAGSAGNELPIAAQKSSVTTHTIKARRNVLDPLIDRAIVKAASRDTNAVFPVLRDMALSEEMPFTGNVEGGALHYTDDNGSIKNITKEALAARLKRRRASISDGN